MSITDYYIRHIAQSHSERHGENAIREARERVRALVRQGDSIGADLWIRVTIALKDRANTAGGAD